jgi:hypothetical protein
MNARFAQCQDYQKDLGAQNAPANPQQPLTNTLLPQFRNLITSIITIWILTKRPTSHTLSNPYS